jgi:hypothetical protein
MQADLHRIPALFAVQKGGNRAEVEAFGTEAG